MNRACTLLAFTFACRSRPRIAREVVELLKKAEQLCPARLHLARDSVVRRTRRALKQARVEKRPLFVWIAGGASATARRWSAVEATLPGSVRALSTTPRSSSSPPTTSSRSRSMPTVSPRTTMVTSSARS